jgi:oligoribonuclease (3'-5' exoribonuclease)
MMMIDLMNEHVVEIQELLSSELSDDEFNTKMIELMEKHQQSMSELMQGESIGHDESMDNDEHP